MTIESLVGRQADQLLEHAGRLAASNGADRAAWEAVRKQVGADLLKETHDDRNLVTIQAMGRGSPKQREWIHRVHEHCHEHFYVDGRILSAVVVPVAVSLYSKTEGQVEVKLTHTADDMGIQAEWMAEKVGCGKLVFDRRLYEADDLYNFHPRKLFPFLQKLANGEQLADGGPRATSVKSGPHGRQKMVYLLAVEIREPGSRAVLEDESVQGPLSTFWEAVQISIGESPTLFFTEGIQKDIRCFGFWYLRRGVQEGEDAIRSWSLYQTLQDFDQGDEGVCFWYAKEPIAGNVKLLAVSESMTVEYKWRLRVEESDEGFRRVLDDTITALVPEGMVREKREVDLYEYERLASKAGMPWFNRKPGECG